MPPQNVGKRTEQICYDKVDLPQENLIMRTAFITLVFSFIAIYFAQTIVGLQLKPRSLQAFISIAIFSIALISFPRLSLYFVIVSLTFFDPRYWWSFIRLYLHQWIILASILILAGQRLYQRQKFHILKLDLALGFFLLTFFISYINSIDISLSLKWTTYFFVFLGGYFLLRLSINSEQELGRVIAFLIFCGAITAAIALYRAGAGIRAADLVLRNPNATGNYLTLILPMAIALFFHGNFTIPRKTLLLIAIMMIASSIILTLSRSSWVGCMAGVLALGLIKPKIKYFAVVIPVLIIILFLPPVRQRLVEDRTDPGVTYRQTKIKVAYQMFRERPLLGHGPGGFQAMAPTSEEWAVFAHSAIENMYMRILAEGGLIQAIVFFGLLIYINYLGVSTIKGNTPDNLQAVVVGSLASFWAALGIGVGEDPLLFPMSNWLVGLYLGIIVKCREISGLEKFLI